MIERSEIIIQLRRAAAGAERLRRLSHRTSRSEVR